jgi:LysM repeat protein
MHYIQLLFVFDVLYLSSRSIKIGTTKGEGVRIKTHHWISKVLIIGIGIICMTALPVLANAVDAHNSVINDQAEDVMAELESRVADIWGSDNVWLPSPKAWVQYEGDLGERSAVDFENGVAYVQILLKANDDPWREQVLAHLRQGVGNLVLGDIRDPVAMIKSQGSEMPIIAQNDVVKTTAPEGKEVRVYLVRKGDSLWTIARRFRMKTAMLAKLNEIAIDEILSVGRPLKVIVFSSHDLTLDTTPPRPGSDPLLKNQIRMVDGSPVSKWLVEDFAAEVVGNKPLEVINILGADGFERLAVSVQFKLVSNHLEVRARKFHPLVQAQAEKHELDPALIMAIIHTESMFNPRARSQTPAYGLMQVVPHSAGRDAYRMIYGQNRKLTSKYLYNPKNNIELGVAYFDILRNNYMKGILDPISRTYCAVAAYNAGASNVGRAFISRKSIQKAMSVINKMTPLEVYARLVEALPFKESQNYVRQVLKRYSLYKKW